MKYNLKILLIITLISIHACDSNETVELTECKGTVISYPSYEPESNLLIKITWIDSLVVIDNGFCASTVLGFDTIRTDENGNYSHKLSIADANFYSLDILKKNYTMLNSTSTFNYLLKKNTINTARIIIGKNAFLKLNFINNQELEDNIAVEISGNYLSFEGEDYLRGNLPINLTFNPQFNDTTYLFELAYDFYQIAHIYWYKVDYELIKYYENNIDIELISQDTTTYTIEF